MEWLLYRASDFGDSTNDKLVDVETLDDIKNLPELKQDPNNWLHKGDTYQEVVLNFDEHTIMIYDFYIE